MYPPVWCWPPDRAIARAHSPGGYALALVPARVGYGTAKVDLNVNRDLFNSKLEWRQEPNPEGRSDKTLAVVEFVGNNNVPIGVYMNYAMHPINFYLSGVISADFSGRGVALRRGSVRQPHRRDLQPGRIRRSRPAAGVFTDLHYEIAAAPSPRNSTMPESVSSLSAATTTRTGFPAPSSSAFTRHLNTFAFFDFVASSSASADASASGGADGGGGSGGGSSSAG